MKIKLLKCLLLLAGMLAGRAHAGTLYLTVVNNTGTNVSWRIVYWRNETDAPDGTWTPTGSSAQPTGTTVNESTGNSINWSGTGYFRFEWRTTGGASTGVYEPTTFTYNGYGNDTTVNWTLGPASDPAGYYCVTNTSQNPGIFVIRCPGIGDEQQTLGPGDYWCVDSEAAYTVNIIEIIGTIGGGALTNETQIFEWEPDDGHITNSTSWNPAPKPVSTAGGAFNSPTNDAQNSANGITGQLQNNQNQENINAQNQLDKLGAVTNLLSQIKHNATNYNSELTNHVNDAVTAGNASSNLVASSAYNTNTMMGAISGSGGSLDPGSGPSSVDLSGGDARLSLLQLDITSFPAVTGLRDWIWRMFLYLAKILSLAYSFKHLLKSFADFGNAMKGNGTSGFLQAAVISVPNLFSSLGGMAARWKVAAALIPTIYALIIAGVTQVNAVDGMPSGLADLAPSSTVVAYGWSLFKWFVPVELMFRIFMITLSGCLLMTLTVFGAAVITDATSKA